MNRRQKLIQQQFLNNEKAVIKRLKQVYGQSQKDIESKINNLSFKIGELQQEYDWLDPDDPERAKIKSMIQSKIYQKQYQEQLKSQVDGILKQMQTQSYLTVSAYLDECYTDGFIGTIFDAQGQGVPIMTPINQESMVRAVQLESKISKGLYTRLGEDVDLLKRKITAQVSRSISTGMTFAQTAQQLAGYTNIGFNNAVRIARTEGHRVQTTAAMDAMIAAKEKGADIVKQWDSTLDGKTRPSHISVDGEIRELDKPFSNGLDFPGDPAGGAAEVVNCRCALLQRANWALSDEQFTKMNNFTRQLESFDSPDTYKEFKKSFFSSENKKYMNYVQSMENKYHTKDFPKLLKKMTDSEYQHYFNLLGANPVYNKSVKNQFTRVETETSNELKQLQIEYNAVRDHIKSLSDDDIIRMISGGDRTSGSCASVALAYVGQKQGWNVLDFRGGDSRWYFSGKANKVKMFKALGVTSIEENSAKSNLTNGKRILKQLAGGKEYYLSVGRHAAIVRNTGGVLQYLELQSPNKSGWHDFDNIANTLKYRFGCTSSSAHYPIAYATDISQLTGNDFRTILGYINTDIMEQKKGLNGSVK